MISLAPEKDATNEIITARADHGIKLLPCEQMRSQTYDSASLLASII